MARDRAAVAAFNRGMAARARADKMRPKEPIQKETVADTTTTIEALGAPTAAAQAPGPPAQAPGTVYRSQVRALRAIDRNEPGKTAGNKTYRQARCHPYNVKQTPQEYAAPWGWRRGKAVRAKTPASGSTIPMGLLLLPGPPQYPPAPAPAPVPAPLPLPLPQPEPVAPKPIASAPVPAPAPAPAQPSPPPRVLVEPAWLQQLNMDAQGRQASNVFSGMWAEMQLRKTLNGVLKKAEEVKLAVPQPPPAPDSKPAPELQSAPNLQSAPGLQSAHILQSAPAMPSAPEPQPAPLPTIVDRPTARPVPKALTDEEMARYLDLVEKNDEWRKPDIPLETQREKWASAARKKEPEYIRYVTEALADRFGGNRPEKYEGSARKIAAPRKKAS